MDGSGAAYVTGFTYSTDYPTQSPYQAANKGGPGGNAADALVSKLSPSGDTLVYSTYLGGNGYDMGIGIAVDAAGAIYVAGADGLDRLPRAIGVPGGQPRRPGRLCHKAIAGRQCLGLFDLPGR